MATFNKESNYVPNAGIQGVQIGTSAPILEADLNEIGIISKNLLREMLFLMYGNGVSSDCTIAYSVNKVTVSGGFALANGICVRLGALEIAVANNVTRQIYLKVWEDIVPASEDYKQYGNQQSVTEYDNASRDPRYPEAYSQRYALKYTLTTATAADDATYVQIANCVNGVLTLLPYRLKNPLALAAKLAEIMGSSNWYDTPTANLANVLKTDGSRQVAGSLTVTGTLTANKVIGATYA